MEQPEIILLGGPNSGKTHFAGQLYGRLKRKPGELALDGTPKDLSALEGVLAALSSGHAAGRTAAATWAEVCLPIVNSKGVRINLRWPDYGGEQVNEIYDTRTVPDSWRKQLRTATGWLIMIRLSTETTYRETLQHPDRTGASVPPDLTRIAKWDANARWVELLQILLQIAGYGLVKQLTQPRLTILLSCYDELAPIEMQADAIQVAQWAQANQPDTLLAAKLPLLHAFVHSIWTPDSISVWGLSALGKHLDKDSSDDSFIDEGPESHGWVIAPEAGAPDSDLTRPLSWLLPSQ